MRTFIRLATFAMLLTALPAFTQGQGEWFLRYDPVRLFLTPNDRSFSAGVSFAVDDLVYFGGGYSNGDYMTDIYTHNVVTGVQGSIPLPSYMEPFRSGVAFTLGGTAYFGLGHDNAFGAFSEIQSFSPGGGYGYPMIAFPGGARHGAIAFTVGGKAYIGGGQNAVWDPVNDLWEFDPAGPTWTPKAPLPVAVESGGVTFELDGIGYVVPDGSNQLRAYDPVTNSWSLRAPFPGGARTAAVGFFYEGKGYVGTGLLSGQRKSDFFIYDPTTDSWSPGPRIWDAYGRDGAAAVSHNGRAYVLGGSASAEVWELGPPQPLVPGTWVQRPFLPGPPRTNPVTFTIGNRAYVGGGSNVNATWARQFFAYDPLMREWTPRADLPATSSLSASVDGSGYILTGGATGNFWAYDHVQDNWSPRADMPAPRSNAVAFGLMGKIYIATGILDGVRRKDLWAYDPQTDTWEEKAEMIGSAVHQAAAFALPDRACVLGGNLSGGSTNASQVRCYDPVGDQWTYGTQLNGNTNLLMAFAIGNTGYRAGGIVSTNFILDALQSYDPVSNSWTPHASLGGGWRAQGGAFGLAGSGFVVAGRLSPNNNNTASSFYYNDLWEYITWESYADDSPTGTLFIDEDNDCVLSGGDQGLPAQVLVIQPGNYVSSTAPDGSYGLLLLPPGEHTIAPASAYLAGSCGDAAQPFTMPVTGPPPVVDLPVQALDVADVMVSMSSGQARVGFDHSQAVLLKNLAFASSGALELTVETDAVLQFLSATPPPTSVNGATLTWQLPALAGQAETTVIIEYAIPANIGLLGYVTQTNATVTTVAVDADGSNNSVLHMRQITAAYDPNDKLAQTNTGGTQYWTLGEDEWIDYTIRFQNTGTDTAFNVLITDTLPADLDAASIIVAAASHPYTWDLRGQGILRFHFSNVLLPDSNVNEPLSHGFVGFRVRPRSPQDLQPGDQLVNTANIYFDFNPPVITEPSILTVPLPGVLVAPRMLLDGPYVQATQRMNDGLRSTGLLPLVEPYTALGYGHVGGGGESVAPAVLAATGDNAIVDWVLVELRSATSPYAVLATRSALLQRDGDVVATNGTGPVTFSQAAGNYRIAVRHRNHLVAMTNAAVALNTSTATLVDLSAAATATFGTNARKAVGTRMVLWPGDANFDGEVKYTGANNDRDAVLVRIGGSTPTTVVSGYYMEDANLDGDVKYTGTGNDRDIILQTIGGVVPTAVREEQIP